ncbi:MAG: hypothetical protein IJ372_17580, partial [Rhodococcus sp.]|nr:hypothetical protein [Rhodococcus sp. (in: high G+C Gram-positive bacteria)]
NMRPDNAATLAQIISSIMFLSMSLTINIAGSVGEIVEDISGQVSVLLAQADAPKMMRSD